MSNKIGLSDIHCVIWYGMVWCISVMTAMSVIYKELRCVYMYSGSVSNCVIIYIDIDTTVCASHSYL